MVCAAIAQSVERRHGKAKVTGSNPVRGSISNKYSTALVYKPEQFFVSHRLSPLIANKSFRKHLKTTVRVDTPLVRELILINFKEYLWLLEIE